MGLVARATFGEAVGDYPGLDHVVSRAYGVLVHCSNDAVGAAVAVELE